MQNIFLAPVSGKNLFINFEKTVKSGILTSDFFKKKATGQYKSKLSGLDFVKLWGVKNFKISSFDKIKVGDYIFFYHNGEIIASVQVSFKDKNEGLSIDLWGVHNNSQKGITETWENLVFLENYIDLKMSFKVLIQFAEYSEKASVRGFNIFRESGTLKIISKHKTINEFLKSYTK